MKNIQFFEDFTGSNFSPEAIQEDHNGGHELDNYMFFQNLHTLKRIVDAMLELDQHEVDQILTNGHGWALDHIATSVDDVEEVYHFMTNSIDMGYHGDEEQHGGAEPLAIPVDLVTGIEDESDEDDDEDDE